MGTTVPKPFNLSTDARGQWNKDHVPKAVPVDDVEIVPFKAREPPASLYEPQKFEKPAPKKLTEGRHFSLRSDNLYKEAENNKKKALEDQIARESAARIFTARPLPKSMHSPYVPTKDHHEPVIAEPIVLSSEQRAEERAAFEEYLREKEANKQREKEAELRKQMERDQAEVAELRASQSFKAKKMPDFSKPWTPEPSGSRPNSAARARPGLSAEEKAHRRSLEFKSKPMPQFDRDPRPANRKSTVINTGIGPGLDANKRASLSPSTSAYGKEIGSSMKANKSASAAAGRQWGTASPRTTTTPTSGKPNLLEKAMAKERARRASLKSSTSASASDAGSDDLNAKVKENSGMFS